MNYGLLNLGSLLLGLVAWVLPVVSLVKIRKGELKSRVVLSLISVSACAVSLLMQILYGNYLVRIEDWSALMDTSNATATLSAQLLAITIILNVITFFVYRRRKQSEAAS